MSLLEFIDLGQQPIANGFVSREQLNCPDFVEPKFSLRAGLDESTYLVSLMEFVDSWVLFNKNYAYHSSGSQTMRDHFRDIATTIKERFKPKKILEIGSNDGVFLQHFSVNNALAVEPCANFADITRELGYDTYPNF